VDVEEAGIDLLSMSAHKFYGPKGVGALYVRSKKPRVRLCPIIDGGGHERGMRSGTLNVAGIVGLAKAMVLGCEEQQCERQRLTQMRDHFIRDMMHRLDGVTLNGHPTKRLFGNVNLSFAGVDAGKLTLSLKNVACSAGSACASHGGKPSHVILAMTGDEGRARSSVRFSFGRMTTDEELEIAKDEIVAAVTRLRAKSVEYELIKTC